MTQEQRIHIGMVNSFNLITERNTLDEIVSSDISLFAHFPDEEIPFDLIKLMMNYFQSFEMFEHCAELMEYMEDNFNDDGTRIVNDCECPQPLIENYSKKSYCGICEKRMRI
jgi:hypothetical protein